MKFSPFPQDTLVPPCGSKIRSKSLYLLRFLRYCHFFIFRKNPRWPPKVAKIEISPLWTRDSCSTLRVKNSLEIKIFSHLTGDSCTTLWHPVGQKFARNRSISYSFRDIDTFSFSAKIQDGCQKWRKLKFSPFDRRLLYHPVGQKFDTFSFSAKIIDGRQKWRKLKFSPFAQDTPVPPCGS